MSDKQSFYSLKRILTKNAQYNMIYGERSNGKTYAGLEYALDRVDYRMTLNADGQKPFIILVNGKAINTLGQLESFLNGEFSINAVDIEENNVKALYS